MGMTPRDRATSLAAMYAAPRPPPRTGRATIRAMDDPGNVWVARTQVPAAEREDDGAVEGADVGGVIRPSRPGPGRRGGAVVVRVSSRWGRLFGGDL